MKQPIFIRKRGNQSFAEGHGTRYWEFSLNPKRFKLKRHEYASIIHYDNDEARSKKYHVYLSQGFRSIESNVDNLKEAFDILRRYLIT